MPVTTVTDATFEREVLGADTPVLIDLYADWCGPCKQVAPILEDLSRELAGKVKFVKVDIDHNIKIAQSFRVQSIPMLVIMAEGKVANVLMGAQPKQQILAALEPLLPRDPGEVTVKELAALVGARRVLVVDTRDDFSYRRAHLPTAIHVPVDQLAGQSAELRKAGRPVIVYGRTGADSEAAGKTARDAGIPSAHLKGGLLEWEGDGLPIERPN
jgi:thioredoxin 1